MPTALTYAKWEDLAEGAQHELTAGPITRTDLVRYAGASGDFNPNHHDEIYAIRAGFEKPFAQGMLQGGYLGRALSEWLGPTALRKLRLRFSAQAWPGEVEILDLRTIVPWDRAAVLESVRKTGKCLVVHEDTVTAGFGAEVAALVAAEAFTDLDAPVTRIATPDSPIPYNAGLTAAVVPSVPAIARALEQLLAF